MNLSSNWKDLNERERQRYFETVELARLEYEERSKSEPEMAKKAKAKASKVLKVLKIANGKPTLPPKSFSLFVRDNYEKLRDYEKYQVIIYKPTSTRELNKSNCLDDMFPGKFRWTSSTSNEENERDLGIDERNAKGRLP